MSEFYASGSFLDRKHLFTKYYSIISCISLREFEIEAAANSLKQYSGFGIETQIANLDRCCRQLKDLKEDVRTEFYSLVKIVDTVNEYEKRAEGIFGGTLISSSKSDFTLKEYNISSEPMKFSSVIINSLTDFIDSITNDMGLLEYLDYMDGGFEFIADLLGEDYMTSPINFLKAASDLFSMLSGQTGDYTESVLSFLKNGVKTIKDGFEVLTKSGFKFTDSTNEAVSYLGVVGVALTTLLSGYKSYNEYSADGEMSVNDWCLTLIDGSVDGLFTCVEALIKSFGGDAISHGLGFADDTLDLSGKVKSAIKDYADRDAYDLGTTILNNKELNEFYQSSSPVTQTLIRVALLHHGVRGIVKFFS